MPIIRSAKKQLRKSQKNKSKNDHFRALYRESRVAFENAIKIKDLEKAKEIYVNKKNEEGKTIRAWLQSNIDKLVKKNIIHANNWARRKAKFVRMMKWIS